MGGGHNKNVPTPDCLFHAMLASVGTRKYVLVGARKYDPVAIGRLCAIEAAEVVCHAADVFIFPTNSSTPRRPKRATMVYHERIEFLNMNSRQEKLKKLEIARIGCVAPLDSVAKSYTTILGCEPVRSEKITRPR